MHLALIAFAQDFMTFQARPRSFFYQLSMKRSRPESQYADAMLCLRLLTRIDSLLHKYVVCAFLIARF